MNSDITNKSVTTRFYNHIIFKDGKVIKGVPRNRIGKEVGWFKEAIKKIPNNIPQIYDYDNDIVDTDKNKDLKYYEMQAIDGDNLYNWSIQNKNLAFAMFDNLLRLTNYMHRGFYVAKKKDIDLMYYFKPKIAMQKFIREHRLNPESLKINNISINNPITSLDDVFNSFRERLYNTKYSFIHGDLTMSNVLVGRDKKPYLIDPRGEFGKTKLYGDIRYDVAKLYYSIVGNFDSLNNGRFSYKYKRKDDNHIYLIEDNGFGKYGERMLAESHEDPEVIAYIHTTIWLSLVPHTSNNPRQQFCAFCQGAFLLNTLSNHGK